MSGNPFDAMSGPVRDLHEMAGRPGILYNDAQSAPPDDWLAQSEPEDDYGPGQEITIRVEGVGIEETSGPAGEETTGDATIVVDPSELNRGAEDVTGGEPDRLASQVEDTTTGKRYELIEVTDQGTGVLRCPATLLS